MALLRKCVIEMYTLRHAGHPLPSLSVMLKRPDFPIMQLLQQTLYEKTSVFYSAGMAEFSRYTAQRRLCSSPVGVAEVQSPSMQPQTFVSVSKHGRSHPPPCVYVDRANVGSKLLNAKE